MLECLVLGDSLASGVGGARPECVTTARVGITSGTYINELFPLTPHAAQTAVISLGVNDDPSMDTLGNLRQVRAALTVGSVVWLLPGLKENVREAIRTVAAQYGDKLVDTLPQVGADHLHPSGAGYRILASETLAPGAYPDTEVAFAPLTLSPAGRNLAERRLAEPRLAGREREDPPFALGLGGSSRYRLHVVFRGKLQQMADLRLQLAHQQAGYARWPTPHVTYGALPPPSYAYAAFTAMGAPSNMAGNTPGTITGSMSGTTARSFTPLPAWSTAFTAR